MDGLLYIAFFFPMILCCNIFLNWITLVVTLWAGFGVQLGRQFAETYLASNVLPKWSTHAVVAVLSNPPLKHYGHFLYPLLLNFVHIVTVIGSYSLGKALYNKRGWSMVQPLRGGLRFVVLQTIQWCVFAVALCIPWMSFENFGLMTYFGAVKNSQEDDSSFGGLLVSSAAMGMLAQSLVTVALMVFEENSGKSGQDHPSAALRSLETGSWNFYKMFGEASGMFWWLFLASQTSLVMFSVPIATLADREIQNQSIRGLMAMVLVSVLIVALSLTNAVGGKWRHGEKKFQLFMPFRGGLVFMMLQALGWCFFGLAIMTIVAQFSDISFLPTELGDSMMQSGLLRTACVMGFASQALIVGSLFFFDPKKVGKSLFLQQLEKASPSSKSADKKEEGSNTSRIRSGSSTVSPSRRLRKRTTRAMAESNPTERATGRRSGFMTNACGHNTSREGWVIERIIGKRPKPDTDGEFEFLVQWQSPTRSSDWVMVQGLLTKISSAAAHDAINTYERQRSQAGQLSDEEDASEDSSSSGEESPSTAENSSSEEEVKEVSRPLSRNRRGMATTRRGMATTRRGMAAARRGRSKTPNKPSARTIKRSAESTSPSYNEHEWEECEDEMGNVYYYCLTTGKTAHELSL